MTVIFLRKVMGSSSLLGRVARASARPQAATERSEQFQPLVPQITRRCRGYRQIRDGEKGAPGEGSRSLVHRPQDGRQRVVTPSRRQSSMMIPGPLMSSIDSISAHCSGSSPVQSYHATISSSENMLRSITRSVTPKNMVLTM